MKSTFTTEMIRKQTEIEHALLVGIMTQILKREPTKSDRLQFEITTHPRYDDRYLFSHNGEVLGMVIRSFEPNPKVAGNAFKIRLDPNIKYFY